MAIYPVIDGQKLDQRNVIPPHHAKTAVHHQPTRTDQPKEPKEPQQPNDLIDFGQDEVSETKPSAQPAVAPAPIPTAAPAPAPAPAKPSNSTKAPSEIESLLSSTGKPAEGPLIDFTNDLKKDLPRQTQN